MGASISPMTRIQLRTGLHLVWQGREYVIEQCLASGEIQIKDQLTNTKSILKAVALTQLLFQGELQFLQVDAATTNQVTRLGLSADFTQIPTELREEAKRRYKYVERVLESNVLKKNESELKPIIERVANEIEDSQPPSWLTLYRWLKDYSASGKNIRSLVPKHLAKGNRQPRLHPEVEKIVEKAIHQVYLKPEQAQGTDVHDRVIVEINQSNRLP